jgi:hypothetical protein
MVYRGGAGGRKSAETYFQILQANKHLDENSE